MSVSDSDPSDISERAYSYNYNDDGSVASRAQYGIEDGVKKLEYIYDEDYDSAGHVIRETQVGYEDNIMNSVYVSDYTYDYLGHIIWDNTRKVYDIEDDEDYSRKTLFIYNIYSGHVITAGDNQDLLSQPDSWESLEEIVQLPSPESVITGIEKAETIEENGVKCLRFILPKEETDKVAGFESLQNRFKIVNTTAHDQANLCFLLYQAVLSQALGIEVNEDYKNCFIITIGGEQVAMIKMVCEKDLGLCLDVLIPNTEEGAAALFANNGNGFSLSTWEDSKAIELEEPNIDAYATLAESNEPYEVDNNSAHENADTDTIKKVQEALNATGYDCGAVDGAKGPHTTEVIQQYQTDNGLDPTGEIDEALLSSLGIQ